MAVVQNAAVNVGRHVFFFCLFVFDLVFLFSLFKYSEVDLLGHTAALFLIFGGTAMLFSVVAAPVCSLSVISARGFSSGTFPAGEVLGLTVGGDAVSTRGQGPRGFSELSPSSRAPCAGRMVCRR